MAAGMKINVPRTGRVQKPRLDNGELTAMGNIIVEEQKKRWANAIDADGRPAKPLAKPYMFYKAAVRHTNRPKRDMWLTGATVANFQLRKAIDNTIRAENTTKKERDKARGAGIFAQMIGFAPSDLTTVFKEAQKAYGKFVKRAWVRVK